MTHKTARQLQVEAYRDQNARNAIRHNFFGGLICERIAAEQLRDTGMFEAEIKEALSR